VYLVGWVYARTVDLEAGGISNEELEQQATFLAGATMPNGQKYEEWLKGKALLGRMGRTAALRDSSRRTSEKAAAC
jgi:hypothetical protein